MILAFSARHMDRLTLDGLFTRMLQTSTDVSDLLFISGKQPLVEVHGRLQGVPIDASGSVLTPAFTQELAESMINGNDRLEKDLANTGSCDCSYAIESLARFRVNIFKQNGRHACVMRKLQSEIPTLQKLAMPPVFEEIIKEQHGIIFVEDDDFGGDA